MTVKSVPVPAGGAKNPGLSRALLAVIILVVPYHLQGLGVQLTNHDTDTIGTGSAVVNLPTTNGSITVTVK